MGYWVKRGHRVCFVPSLDDAQFEDRICLSGGLAGNVYAGTNFGNHAQVRIDPQLDTNFQQQPLPDPNRREEMVADGREAAAQI